MRIHALIGSALAVSLGASASAQLSNYSQDFEALDRTDFDALSNDGWLTFAAGVNGDASFPNFGAGPFPTPNNIVSPFQAVISDVPSGGVPPSGDQGLVILSDYNSDLHTNPADTRDLVISVFQEQIVGAGDIGSVVTFDFLAQGNTAPPTGDALTGAFLITLDPNNGFAATNDLFFDTTALATGAQVNGQLTLDLSDPALEGQILQFGFRNTSSDFEGSAVDYDNVSFVIPEPSSMLLAGAGLAGLAARRRRRA